MIDFFHDGGYGVKESYQVGDLVIIYNPVQELHGTVIEFDKAMFPETYKVSFTDPKLLDEWVTVARMMPEGNDY